MSQLEKEDKKVEIAFRLLEHLVNSTGSVNERHIRALPALAAEMTNFLFDRLADNKHEHSLPIGTIITVRGNDTEEDDALTNLILTENGWEPCPPRKCSFTFSGLGLGERLVVTQKD